MRPLRTFAKVQECFSSGCFTEEIFAFHLIGPDQVAKSNWGLGGKFSLSGGEFFLMNPN